MSISRIGHGYDVHAFADGGGFVLGGVLISCDKAVVAHSDGDVLIHALCDALLGALGRGDIGRMFPDSDAHNEDRDSREFLRAIKQLIDADGFCLGNADVTIIAQAPKMSPHIDAMKEADDGIPQTVAPIEEVQLYVRNANGERRDVTLRQLIDETMGMPRSRADMQISQGRDGELLLSSRQDGMIRVLVAD